MKIATVFSGIGSPEQALKKLDIEHEIVFACDVDKYCKQTYFANHNIKEEQWYNDVATLDGTKYKDSVDLFVGGSPCQSFSVVGLRKGFDDTRGNLFYEYVRLVHEIQPKVFIFENVKGLLSDFNSWGVVKNEFKKLGYDTYSSILNAVDYGIPQNRQRLFVVGFKSRLELGVFDFPKAVKLELTMQDLLESVVDDKYYLSDKMKKFVLSYGTGGFYVVPRTDKPIASTLLSTMSKMHRASTDNYITKGDTLRRLTPRECLRLMGFPDDFKIVVSDNQVYMQTGNSMVVNVLAHLINSIIETGVI